MNETFAFVDIETTGLDPRVDKILEYGTIIVQEGAGLTNMLNIVVNPCTWPKLSPVVLDMHTKNGLIRDCNASTKFITDLDRDVSEFYAKFGKKLVLAGSGVGHFDFNFIKEQMPKTRECLQYYVNDVGVWRRGFKWLGYGGQLKKPKKKPHRALEDCKIHVEEWQEIKRVMASCFDIPF